MSSGASTESGTVPLKTHQTPVLQPAQFYAVLTLVAATAAVLVSRETSFANLLLVSLSVMAAGLVAVAAHRMIAPLVGAPSVSARVPGGDSLLTSSVPSRAALEREKHLALRTIKELEFDRAMGKVAEPDFQEMAGRLRARAIGLMTALDERPPDWRDAIEREIARRLADGPTPARPACSACGTRNDPDARFCKHCGQRVVAEPQAAS